MAAIVKAMRRRLLSQDVKAQKHVHGLHDSELKAMLNLKITKMPIQLLNQTNLH